jgi:hypothetical protein
MRDGMVVRDRGFEKIAGTENHRREANLRYSSRNAKSSESSGKSGAYVHVGVAPRTR